MTEFNKRFGLPPGAAALRNDVEDALSRQRTSLTTELEAYDPGDPSQWASPPPTTVREALDRLAKAGATATWPA